MNLSESLEHSLNNIKIPLCTKHEEKPKKFSYICPEKSCTKCEQSGSRLFCVHCLAQGTNNHTNLKSLKKYLSEIASTANQQRGCDEMDQQLKIFFKNAKSNLVHYREQILQTVQAYFKQRLDFLEETQKSLGLLDNQPDRKTLIQNLLRKNENSEGFTNIDEFLKE